MSAELSFCVFCVGLPAVPQDFLIIEPMSFSYCRHCRLNVQRHNLPVLTRGAKLVRTVGSVAPPKSWPKSSKTWKT